MIPELADFVTQHKAAETVAAGWVFREAQIAWPSIVAFCKSSWESGRGVLPSLKQFFIGKPAPDPAGTAALIASSKTNNPESQNPNK